MPESSSSGSGNGSGPAGSGNASAPQTLSIDATQFATMFATAFAQAQAQLNTTQPAGTASQAPAPTPAPPPVASTQVIANPGTSTTSIPDLFPFVDEAVLHDIAAHTFKPSDLWKLDERIANLADRKQRILDLDTMSFSDNLSPRSFPTLAHLLIPLEVYHQVLLAYLSGNNSVTTILQISRYFTKFRASLIRFNEQYRWSAVQLYFTNFFMERRSEMRSGSYSGWATIDHQLQAEYLFGQNRPAAVTSSSSGSSAKSKPRSEDRKGQICFAFNTLSGCSSPCPEGRKHICRDCHKAKGTEHAHSSKDAACPNSSSR
ncbi:hypothetical protein EXIGLDRAFT_793139 [Exidia glandulosa HHB12029]|uniref:Uncharacterized protein n=1 Tax=Exidia glandulosa HHB12029 TaxID=1314781 RepID=A0A165GUM7_EXIGL|nr:hypothetical protein EXIGLDRAFT_793139 [Exidia glandulosa HHB12029]